MYLSSVDIKATFKTLTAHRVYTLGTIYICSKLMNKFLDKLSSMQQSVNFKRQLKRGRGHV